MNRRDSRSRNRKSLQQRHILSSLATWGEADGFAKLVKKVFDNPGWEASSHKGDDIEEEDKRVNTNIKQCLRKVADGHFTTAVKVLGSSGAEIGRAHV